MTKKRTASESSNDDQTNEDRAKRAKLDSLSDTTLEDLPNEALRVILVKAVVMEVKGMKLTKRVWKEKADLVISQLRTVCSRWSDIATTDLFRSEVHGILDGTAEETMRWESLLQCPIQLFVFRVATIQDDLFMLCRPEHEDPFINIHDRNNMAEVKDVIPLSGILPVDMAPCSVFNCLYVLHVESHCRSVLRITRDEEQQFSISPWITNLSLSFSDMRLFVSLNGDLIILSHQNRPNPTVVSIYDANGLLQQEVMLSKDILGFVGAFSVIQKSNGNLVLATFDHDHDYVTELKEADATGRLVRQYQSSIFGDNGITVADIYGRIAILGMHNESELLDSEFNLLLSTDPQQDDGRIFHLPRGLHYNRERNEIVRLYEIASDNRTRALAISRFTEE